VAPGTSVGKGLTEKSAEEMELRPGIVVATSLIDAHCGGVGLLGGKWDNDESTGHVTSRLALIGGTSTCHMVVSNTPVYVPGVWGPYYSAILPGYYLNEGRQSSAGQLLDYVLQSNTHLYSKLEEKASSRQCSVYEEIEQTLHTLSLHLCHPSLLTSHLHVVPDFHGNRCPFADPTILGMVSGQSMILTEGDLLVFYLAVVQALAACLWFYILAEEESVLLGAGILAAAAARNEEVSVVMRNVSSGDSRTVEPTSDPAVRLFSIWVL
jgi:ribulose kinase